MIQNSITRPPFNLHGRTQRRLRGQSEPELPDGLVAILYIPKLKRRSGALTQQPPSDEILLDLPCLFNTPA